MAAQLGSWLPNLADGAATVALDGVGGMSGAGEEEGEGAAEAAKLVEVRGPRAWR